MAIPQKAYGMHIMEGFLPVRWCGFWTILVLPFLFLGYRSIKSLIAEKPSLKMMLALAGAFAFVLSALKIPSVTGSSSHMTGIALGAILLGPYVMSILGAIVLLFQALLLAHGGITTLGANVFSMAVAGPFVVYYIFRLSRALQLPVWLSVFMAAAIGDMITYIATSGQLALAFPLAQGGVLLSFYKFIGIFAVTQMPLAIIEGLLTVMAVNFILEYGDQDLNEISLVKRKDVFYDEGSREARI
ncbi:MAG: energy-coupling factor ABC transporter permease [Peptococcaceae bacterium]|nr:energy-coupling factor ABC transporter permease [Peptococcaceae bacterium]